MTRRVAGFIVLLGALFLFSFSPALAQDAPDDTAPDDTAPADADGGAGATGDDVGTAVFGLLQFEGTPDGADEPEAIPVTGVVLIATDSGGDDVGEGESDADGAWEVGLPGAGSYVVTLDPESLPDGVELRDPEDVTRDISVTEGQGQRVIFPLDRGGGLPGSRW